MNKTPEIGQIPSPRSINGLHLKQKQDILAYMIQVVSMTRLDLTFMCIDLITCFDI